MGRRILGVMNFHSQVGLTDPEVIDHCLGGHPDIDPEPGNLGVPNRLFDVIGGHIRRKGKISADGLPQPLSI
jgi:hypothetical protein